MQTQQPLFHKDYVELEYLPDFDCLRVEWNGFVRTEDYKEGLEKLLEFYEKLPIRNILIDQRKRKVLQKESSEWMLTNWFPQFHAAMKTSVKFAFIQSEDIFGKATSKANILEVEKRHQQHDKPIYYHYFDNQAEAQNWLAEK